MRRPAARRAGRHRFVSGKARAHTVKALVIIDAEGRLLCCGQTRPGAIHDLTQVRQAGLVELLARTPGVTQLADAGYQGLQRADRRCGPHSTAGPADQPAAGPMRPSGSASSTGPAT